MRMGIDFGTTRTVVSVSDRGSFPVVSFEDPDGEWLDGYPSVVAEVSGELVYGIDAIAHAYDRGSSTFSSFKRLLSADPAAGASIRIGSIEVSINELFVGYLRALRRDLEQRSNLTRADDEVFEAVIATPAHAPSVQRFLTLDAFRRAGFEVIAMLAEPSAGGLEFAHRYPKTITKNRHTVLVYDLGGGTFDASLVALGDNHHDVLATAGLSRLGGHDFDLALFSLALESRALHVEDLSSRSVAMLLEHCREQKERLNPNSKRLMLELGQQLSDEERASLSIDEDDVVTVKVADYYEQVTPLVDRTIEKAESVLEAADALDELAGVYVVGGAAALPIVGRRLKERYGRKVRRSQNPFAATAVGLAIMSEDPDAIRITEQLGRHFGVFREARSGDRVAFDTIMDDTTIVPAKGEKTEVVRTYRAAHNVGHFRFVECGELEDGVPAGDIIPLSEIWFPFDASMRDEEGALASRTVQRTGDGPLIEERYWIGPQGIVEMTITDLESGYSKSHALPRAGSSEMASISGSSKTASSESQSAR